jgi:hypothetical protein
MDFNVLLHPLNSARLAALDTVLADPALKTQALNNMRIYIDHSVSESRKRSSRSNDTNMDIAQPIPNIYPAPNTPEEPDSLPKFSPAINKLIQNTSTSLVCLAFKKVEILKDLDTTRLTKINGTVPDKTPKKWHEFLNSISAISERVALVTSLNDSRLKTLTERLQTNQDNTEAVSISYDKYVLLMAPHISIDVMLYALAAKNLDTRSDFIYNQLKHQEIRDSRDKSKAIFLEQKRIKDLEPITRKDLLTAKDILKRLGPKTKSEKSGHKLPIRPALKPKSLTNHRPESSKKTPKNVGLPRAQIARARGTQLVKPKGKGSTRS